MLEGLEPTNDKRPCRVRTLLNELDEKDEQILAAAIKDANKWSTTGLSSALSSRGLSLSKDSIAKHRKGNCSC